jgi:hypothetical protein
VFSLHVAFLEPWCSRQTDTALCLGAVGCGHLATAAMHMRPVVYFCCVLLRGLPALFSLNTSLVPASLAGVINVVGDPNASQWGGLGRQLGVVLLLLICARRACHCSILYVDNSCLHSNSYRTSLRPPPTAAGDLRRWVGGLNSEYTGVGNAVTDAVSFGILFECVFFEWMRRVRARDFTTEILHCMTCLSGF